MKMVEEEVPWLVPVREGPVMREAFWGQCQNPSASNVVNDLQARTEPPEEIWISASVALQSWRVVVRA